MNTIRYPAEWEEQDGVLLAWPHEGTHWKPYLSRARETFVRIIAEASHHGRVIVVTANAAELHHFLQHTNALSNRIQCCPIPCNDTWARDFGPITVLENHHPVLLDCQFNGWGGKFAANLDNDISAKLKEHGVFGPVHLRHVHLILEGGSIETDGQGTILTTSSCNANPNRNPHMSRIDTELAFTKFLGANRVIWLNHGYLAGDDTDGHVDMLVRFAPHDTLVYQTCDNPSDEHFPELSAMAEELKRLRTREGSPYHLIPLPWPAAQYDEEHHRLPISYANYLVLNGVVLAPIYNDPCDSLALTLIGKAYPGRKVIGIDCSALILQHGSLHCVTMQLPKGVLG